MSRSINYGRTHGLLTFLGAMLGILVHSALVALGISLLIVAAPPLFLALKIVGAVYLLWLAFQAVRKGGGFRLAAAARQRPTLWQSFLAGVMIDLLNPKVVLFFVTFLPQFVHAADPGAPGQLFFLGLEYFMLSLPAGVALVWFADWIARALTRSRLVERVLNWGFAGVFTTFAYAHVMNLPTQKRFRELLQESFDVVEVTPIVWRNVPPALAYQCRNR